MTPTKLLGAWQYFAGEVLWTLAPRFSRSVFYCNKEDFRDAINLRRKSANLSPLRICTELSSIANRYAATLAASESYGCESERQLIRVYPALVNYPRWQPSVSEAVQSWMDNMPDRNKLLGNYTRLGVGRAKCSDGQLFWIFEFGA